MVLSQLGLGNVSSIEVVLLIYRMCQWHIDGVSSMSIVLVVNGLYLHSIKFASNISV